MSASAFMRHPYGVDDRTFLLEFIRVYHQLPSLWNTKCIEYCDRGRKSADYELLLRKFRERYPKADKTDMKRKINSIRTNYRRELKRIHEQNCNGVKSEPTLWYFHELSFIKDTESADMPRHSGEERAHKQKHSSRPVEIRPISVKLPPTLVRKPSAPARPPPSVVIPEAMPPLARLPQIKVASRERLCEPMREEFHQPLQPPHPVQLSQSAVHSAQEVSQDPPPAPVNGRSGRKTKKKKKRSAVDEMLSLVAKRLRQEPDDCKKIADNWAAKLRQMNARQQLYAEKFINDILFEGVLGNLHLHSVQINNTHMPASPTPTHSELNSHCVPNVTYDDSDAAMDTVQFVTEEITGNDSSDAANGGTAYPYAYYAQQQAQAQAQQQERAQQAQQKQEQEQYQQIDSDIEIDTKFHINTDLHSFN